MPAFSDINFKYTDAEMEMLYAPELLKEAYVDLNGLLHSIREPEKFIVVGPKGAGKTALSSKLLLMGHDEWNMFVDSDVLEQFEFNLLNKTGADKSSQIGGALTTWQFLLILRFIPMFLKDTHFEEANPGFVRLHESLIKYGLLESDKLIGIVQYTSRRGIFGKIKTALAEVKGEVIEEESYKVKDPAHLLSSIKSIFKNVKATDSSYYLILDGLDYIYKNGRSNSVYIADLINAVRELNIFFIKHNISAKAIILIRNEVLKVVPDSNLAKRSNDNGIQLQWYDNSRNPFESSLLAVIKNRAALAGFKGEIGELWYQWFPSRIHGKSSFEFVILNTRYLPRDLISFFREIQRLNKEPPYSTVDVLSALNNYSDWFIQELSDALVGVVHDDVRVELSDMLSDLGRSFSLEQLKNEISNRGLDLKGGSPEQLARDLFNASWIGNRWLTNNKDERYAWKHRKVNANINLKHQMVIHAGLLKTLNLT